MNEVFLKTCDNVKIALNHYKNNLDSVIIIAPGWCMTKDSNAFSKISDVFIRYCDVICFDFRGHGKSSGLFTFTAKEPYDLKAVADYAKECRYKKIYLLGFSLGAAIVLIHASENHVNKIIAVSAPYDFEKIENHMWKKAAWLETFRKFELNRFLSIRPCILPLKKIKPGDIIEKVNSPTLFMAGENDPTVYPWHTEKLYSEALCKKEYKLYLSGCHAEDLYLHYPETFAEDCINWLQEDNL